MAPALVERAPVEHALVVGHGHEPRQQLVQVGQRAAERVDPRGRLGPGRAGRPAAPAGTRGGRPARAAPPADAGSPSTQAVAARTSRIGVGHQHVEPAVGERVDRGLARARLEPLVPLAHPQPGAAAQLLGQPVRSDRVVDQHQSGDRVGSARQRRSTTCRARSCGIRATSSATEGTSIPATTRRASGTPRAWRPRPPPDASPRRDQQAVRPHAPAPRARAAAAHSGGTDVQVHDPPGAVDEKRSSPSQLPDQRRSRRRQHEHHVPPVQQALQRLVLARPEPRPGGARRAA